MLKTFTAFRAITASLIRLLATNVRHLEESKPATDSALSLIARRVCILTVLKVARNIGVLNVGGWFSTQSLAQPRSAVVPSAFDAMTAAQITDVKARTLAVDVSGPIAAALKSNRTLIFDAGSYYLGEYDSSSSLIFRLYGGQWDLRANGDVEFVIRTSTGLGDCFPVVFDLKAAAGSSFGKFRFRDLGYSDNTKYRRGLKAYRMTADGTTGTWGDVSIDCIKCTHCISPISFEGAHRTNRVRGVHVKEIELDNCYYGPLSQNQGDEFTVDMIRSNQVRRVYFAYGCRDHDIRIIDNNPKGSTGTINISRSIGGFNTENLVVKYSCYKASVVNLVYTNINHIDLLGGAIRGIRLHLDIDVPLPAIPLRFINYDGRGNQSAAASSNVVDDITITGLFGASSLAVDTFASYASRGNLSMLAQNSAVGSTTTAAFVLK